MWRPVRALSLCGALEMPHAEKNFSHFVHDSFFEPCLKKSRPDHSSSWAQNAAEVYKEHEAKAQKWSFYSGSGDRYPPSSRYESDGGRGGTDVRQDTNSYLEPLRNDLDRGDIDERVRDKTNHHPFVLPRRDRPDFNADVAFSGTSTSFIGPLYRPPSQEKSLPDVSSDPSAAPSFKIARVELGKLASQSKGQDGIDNELKQFYKELNDLEAEAEEPTKLVTPSYLDIKHPISPYPDKTPAIHPSNHHHGQVPTSQPCGPFPITPSHLVPFTCNAKEKPRPPLPHNNQFFPDGHPPFPPTNFSFPSHAMPPPRFEGPHPPTFIVPYGPPPPRFNYPMTFPKQNNLPPPLPYPIFTHSTRNERPPWNGSPVPPKNWFNPQRMPYNTPFSKDVDERTRQDLQHGDLCRQEDGQFGERILPPMGSVSHEQYRFKEDRKMVLLRGVPGSGKSTLARTLLQQSPDGIVLSTDDYFCQENGYTYDVKLLGDAHNWNQSRARRALDDGRSPVIIDNTNIQGWEMKPYVKMAVDRGYNVEFLEPDTWWKQDAHELEMRNTHRVPRDKISQMLERYERDMTVPVVMNSVEPRHIRPGRPPPEARPRWGASVDCAPNSSSFHSR